MSPPVNLPRYNPQNDVIVSCKVLASGSPILTMAEAWMKNVTCRYYLHGVCREGDHCRFSHSPGSSSSSSVCKFYQLGRCTYGDRCRYDHVKIKNDITNGPKAKSQALPKMAGPKPTVLVGPGKTSRMTPLKRQEMSADSGIGELEELVDSPTVKPDKWAMAAEFVPGQPWRGAGPSSYLGAAQTGLELDHGVAEEVPEEVKAALEGELCPYAMMGECWYGQNCNYLHGEICDLCGKAMLHPLDDEQRKKHIEECTKKHEEDMELSFAIARSRSQVCGICLDIVMDKKPTSEARFGILSNCNHIFCLPCIRKWRQSKQFENKIVRACPECRVKSDFVTPSKFWVEDENEKLKLIEGYKNALSDKPCKYFDQGRGECPFNENCFYKHAYPDGRIASPKPVRRRRRQNAEGEFDRIRQIILQEFIEEYQRTLVLDLEDELEMLLFHAGFWDSDDDSDSDLDFPGFS